MKFYFLSFLFLLLFLGHFAKAQKSYELNVFRTQEAINIDGVLEEETWKSAQKASDFFLTFPYDTAFAKSQTEAMISYDADFLYIAFICHDKDMDKKFVVQSLRRDFDGGRNDFVGVYIDTFGDKTNGFTFGVTPYGVQREALMSDGGDNLNTDWDNRWFSAARINADNWVVEMAIPFKTIRYKSGDAPWGINFARINYKANELSSWVPVPRSFRLTNLAFTGEVFWGEPLPKTGLNAVIIPYVTGAASKDYLKDEPEKISSNYGADAKIAVTSSLNLDITFNPDFSQVEVDRQVTNLERFEIFFPERRQFFLENADLFARFGFSRIRPFFSRRIGIGFDTTTKQIVQNPIAYGLRLSGKLNKNWRVGLLNMQTTRVPTKGIEGQNYTVAAVQRKVFDRSNIAFIAVNRQTTSDSVSEFIWNERDFNRVIGLDYNLASKNGRWIGKFFYHQSLSPKNLHEQYAHASFLQYKTPNWTISWNHEYVGKNYQADVGFVPRKNHWRLEPSIFYRFYPKKENPIINNHGPGIYTNFFWDTEWKLTDQYTELSYEIEFMNTSSFGVYAGNEYIRLFFDFDPSNTGGIPLLSGTEYTTQAIYASFNSNYRKLFTWGISSGYQGYYNGTLFNVEGNMAYRVQPYGSFSLSMSYNQIALPAPYSTADLLLISPRIDFTFTRSLFFTLFMQYNNQSDNVNLNARFQWRFKPVSDLFIVYTDNYFPDDFRTKNRALVLKLTYWLNW
ncbi:MAG: hydrolase [Cytophagales bacterium]|nr:MAG: hydrolase [Cytophagales bacterium]